MCPRLSKLLRHCLNGHAEKFRGRHPEHQIFSFSLISARFNHRCLSVTTIAAIKWPTAAAVCLAARRVRSVVGRNSVTASGDNAPSLLAGQPGRLATQLLCAKHLQSGLLPKREVVCSSLDGSSTCDTYDFSLHCASSTATRCRHLSLTP